MTKKVIKISLPIFTIIVSAMIIFVLMYFKNTAKVEEKKQILIPVKIIKPYHGTLQKIYRISGYIESEDMVTVLPKISGTLLSLNVDIGDFVKKGDIIGEIDSEPYLLTMKQAEAAYFSAKSTFERIEKLYKSKATSKQNYEQAKSQYDAYKSQYELAKLNYSYTKLKAPITGVIIMKHSSVGSLVAPQVPIVTIANLKKLVVKAKIPEKYYYLFIKKEKTFKIWIDIPALNKKHVKVKLKTVSPYISPDTKNFSVKCALDEQIEGLSPGMFIYISFVLDEKKNIYYLPFETLISEKYLWYVDKDFKAQRITVAPIFYNDSYFEISKEYKDYKFIIDGQHFLKENQKVKILNEK